MLNATPHHIGCAVTQLDDASAIYAGALGSGRKTRPFDVASQHVRVCFVELGNSLYLELIAPLDSKAGLASFLRTGFYHVCFLVDDLGQAREGMKARRFLALPAFESAAFAGSPCQFFLSPQKHLIELAQMSANDFGEFFRANLGDER